MLDFSCECLSQGECFIIRTNGYLDAVGGEKLCNAFEAGLAQGRQNFILNLVGSPVINSQGVTSIFEVVEQVVDVHQGKIHYVGLNYTTKNVFRMVGLLLMGKEFETEEEAVKQVSTAPSS